ncbi:MAG TPA: secondary thiamine-phosphate synthase enzyme YjbQ [Patescibacteria group bacterium]
MKTQDKTELVDITRQVESILNKNKITNGLVNILVKHTTCGLMICENDEDLKRDVKNLIQLIPDFNFAHKDGEAGHAKSHILSSIIGHSISLPIADGRLDLGTWQKVMLLELDGPKERELKLTIF